MKIVVLVRSPRTAPDCEDVLPGLTPWDRAAVATAVNLCREGDETLALACGPAADEHALQCALNMGVCGAVRITEPLPHGGNPRTAATILAAALRTEGFDLIIAGQRSADGGTGFTGPAVAHLLRIPHLSSVVAVERSTLAHMDLNMKHRRGRWVHELEASLPLLLAVVEGPESLPASPPDEIESPPIRKHSLAELTLPVNNSPAEQRAKLKPARVTVKMFQNVEQLANHITGRR